MYVYMYIFKMNFLSILYVFIFWVCRCSYWVLDWIFIMGDFGILGIGICLFVLYLFYCMFWFCFNVVFLLI